jgi:hypothetical protein
LSPAHIFQLSGMTRLDHIIYEMFADRTVAAVRALLCCPVKASECEVQRDVTPARENPSAIPRRSGTDGSIPRYCSCRTGQFSLVSAARAAHPRPDNLQAAGRRRHSSAGTSSARRMAVTSASVSLIHVREGRPTAQAANVRDGARLLISLSALHSFRGIKSVSELPPARCSDTDL